MTVGRDRVHCNRYTLIVYLISSFIFLGTKSRADLFVGGPDLIEKLLVVRQENGYDCVQFMGCLFCDLGTSYRLTTAFDSTFFRRVMSIQLHV